MRNLRYHHFLLVTITAQGLINPVRNLAHRLAQVPGVHATVATPTYAHLCMFPNSGTEEEDDVMIKKDGLVSYVAYSDGYDKGFNTDIDDPRRYFAQIKLIGYESLSRVTDFLASRGRPVTCIIYTLVTQWSADVACSLGVPSILYWTQLAAILALFHAYFRQGFSERISAHKHDPSYTINLPGVPRLQIGDIPSMLKGESEDPFLDYYRDIMNTLEKEKERSQQRKSTVLINTFRALETDTFMSASVSDDLNLIPVGPLTNMGVAMQGKDLFEQDKSEYMVWLEAKKERSVVYISFGSLTRHSKSQVEEISKGLKESRRPYLWVVRRDVREEIGGEVVLKGSGDGNEGLVVEWCDQLRVLSHPSIGCFVTHGGWNSTLESIGNGVPMVVLPGWADQATNAKMAEEVWGIGVRAEVNGELGVVEGAELKRCLDVVMGVEEIRKKAEMWKDKANEAAGSDNKLVEFVDGIGIGIGTGIGNGNGNGM